MARRSKRKTKPMKHSGGAEAAAAALLERNLPVLSRSMTFAKMVKENRRFAEHQGPRLALSPLCRRKDQAAMTENERSRYLCAFNMINNDGTLGHLVDIHAEMHMQHTNARLLPWHRVFLYLFEEALHNYHPDVCIPYWDWTKPEEQHFPDWLVGVLPTVQTPTRTINVIRAPGPDGGSSSIAVRRRIAMSQTNYGQFYRDRSTASTARSTSGSAARCPTRRCHRPTRCSGSITPTSIGSGGSGTTARRATIRTRR